MRTPDRVIVAVEGGAPTGGAERIAFDTVRVLSERGIPVVIISSAAKVDAEYAQLPLVTVEPLDLPFHFRRYFDGGKKHMLRNLLEDQEMRRLMNGLLAKYDSPQTIYHAHGFHNVFTQASLHTAVGLQMKTFVTAHDFGLSCPNGTLFDYPAQKICTRRPLSLDCLRCACMGSEAMRLKQLRFARTWAANRLWHLPERLDAILAVSNFEREILARQLGPKATVKTLLNPIDPASTERQTPSTRRTYLWIGRMTAEKDAVTPAATCRELGQAIVFVGDGPLRKEVEAAHPDATFVGWKATQEVKDFQRKARALIFSSRWHETAGLVVLECLAAGVPCIVPTTSAATSWVEDGFNGLTFEAGNRDSLAAALRKLEDDSEVERLGRNAYERYWQSPFTMERYGNDLMDLYSEALMR